MQELEVPMQITDRHIARSDSTFLLVTNSAADPLHTDQLQRFVVDDLSTNVDIWNINLYGGLQERDEASGDTRHVLTSYFGKTVVMLANQFEFFEKASKHRPI